MAQTNLLRYKKTGTIWCQPSSVRTRTVRRVCEIFTNVYGSPRFGNPQDSLDDLIYIILSNKTSPRTARSIYKKVKLRFQSWDDILAAPVSTLRAMLKPAGLHVTKSRHIRSALCLIKDRFGSCDLKQLRKMSPATVENYLVSLPGVSQKVAKCVMMYTLNLPVLPVDTHVHRISRRLGWTARRRADQCHSELEALVPPTLRRKFHVACIVHGRRVCRPQDPKCHNCCIRSYCEYYEAAR